MLGKCPEKVRWTCPGPDVSPAGFGWKHFEKRVFGGFSNKESSQSLKIKFNNSILHLCALLWILGTGS